MNETLREEIDMSEMTRDMLDRNIIPDLTTVRRAPDGGGGKNNVSSDYSSGDFTSDASSPLGDINKQSPGACDEEDENSCSMSSGSGDSESENIRKVIIIADYLLYLNNKIYFFFGFLLNLK